ncbi:MAG: hypothetical protein M1834_008051 [Cirrosporium novae-zelandiae]|nr:MAG: hypothetical protein M1834_008051 [Cirrosporium novae-zelandiae]
MSNAMGEAPTVPQENHFSSHSILIAQSPQRHAGLFLSLSFNSIFTLFLLFLSSLSLASAAAIDIPTLHGSTLAQLSRKGQIIVDPRPSPVPRTSPFEIFERANDASSTATSSTSSPSSTLATAATVSSSSLPTPFDTSLGSNYTTSSCPKYINTFLSDDDFQTCLPFSLLLQNSQSFFQTEKSLVKTTRLLDYTCSVSLANCTTVLNNIALNLISDSYCGNDYLRQNPVVVQAYNGLIAYESLYRASCLIATSGDGEGNYCFANAITNTTNTADSYIYYLPLGTTLPGSSRPTCNQCLRDTMALYTNYASNGTQPLSGTYNAAALQVDLGCGPTFANDSVPITSAAHPRFTGAPSLFTVMVAIGSILLLEQIL